MNLRACLDELQKLGAISDDQAQSALDRLDMLERNKPTLGQAARYATLGAGTGSVAGSIGRLIEGKELTGRGALAGAATGALLSGGVPLIQSHLNRKAEMGTLKRYLAQGEMPSTVMPAGIDTPPDTTPKAI